MATTRNPPPGRRVAAKGRAAPEPAPAAAAGPPAPAEPEPGAPGRGTPTSSADLTDVKFLTVEEVAALMRVSRMTVYRMLHAGTLPAVRVGRSFRVPEDAVHEYLRESFYRAG